jgi:hypothetical protein
MTQSSLGINVQKYILGLKIPSENKLKSILNKQNNGRNVVESMSL